MEDILSIGVVLYRTRDSSLIAGVPLIVYGKLLLNYSLIAYVYSNVYGRLLSDGFLIAYIYSNIYGRPL